MACDSRGGDNGAAIDCWIRYVEASFSRFDADLSLRQNGLDHVCTNHLRSLHANSSDNNA
jgi:hypothetical protein